MYKRQAQDYDETFPLCYELNPGWTMWYWRGNTSPGCLYPYLGNTEVFRCPNDGCYGVNETVFRAAGVHPGRKFGFILKPDATILLADCTQWNANITNGEGGTLSYGRKLHKYSSWAYYLASGCYGGGLTAPRHNRRCNIVFGDGHVGNMLSLIHI